MMKSLLNNRSGFFRDRAPGMLMAFSIVLLLVLQLAWLRSAWHDRREDFKKETNSLFRTTIFAMHDSLILRNMETIQGDSVFYTRRFSPEGTSKSRWYTDIPGDSAGRVETSASVEVFISPENKDSVRRLIRPLMRRMREEPGHKRFFIRFGSDSLNADSLAYLFSGALAKSGIDLPFTVHRLEREGPGMPLRAVGESQEYSNRALVSDPVPFSPGKYYAVAFSGTDSFFLRAIMPEVFFCLFVTLLTSGSFFLMQRSIRSQKHLVKMKSDFISNITHELKTPVATVSVALEAMERFEALDDKQKTREYLGMAQDELGRLILMIDKILQTASFENNAPEIKLEKINLDEEVRAVLKSMKLVFEKRQIQVHYSCRGTDFGMNGSRSHVVTVLYNLVDNAVKYSPTSSTISIDLVANEDVISLAVTDTGIGIPQEYQKRIFDRFFRVPSGDVHNIKGYGLGLNYVAQVVEGHKGQIAVSSHEGQGSCFTIRLPKNTGQ